MRKGLGLGAGRKERTEGAEGVLFRPNVFGAALCPWRVEGEANCESRKEPLLLAYLESLNPPPCA